MDERAIWNFWRKVHKEAGGCWIWTASTDRHGYGQFHRKYPDGRVRQERAHRISWELESGQDPGGLFVLHECDNKRCVNPDHLRLGTNRDNMDDLVMKRIFESVFNRLIDIAASD